MTQLRSVTCHMGSHSVTCHPTQVNTPRLNPSHAGRYSIYLPRRDGRLSWPSWLDSAPAGSRTSDLSITSPTPNYCTTTVICEQSAVGLILFFIVQRHVVAQCISVNRQSSSVSSQSGSFSVHSVSLCLLFYCLVCCPVLIVPVWNWNWAQNRTQLYVDHRAFISCTVQCIHAAVCLLLEHWLPWI